MKTITLAAIIIVLTFVAVSDAGVANTQKIQFHRVIASASGKPCKCIPWRECHGESDPDVYCQPWYGMTCCIMEPEPTVESIENDIKVFDG